MNHNGKSPENRIWDAACSIRGAKDAAKFLARGQGTKKATRPDPELTREEREEVKKVARQLLARLNALLVLGWRQKIQPRAKVRIEIEDALDGLPRAYTEELYKRKCDVLFEHVYESYMGDGRSYTRPRHDLKRRIP